MLQLLVFLVFAAIAGSPLLASQTFQLSRGEVCEISEPINIGGGEDYSKSDMKTTSKLCTYDVHSEPQDDSEGFSKAMAVCPKMNSTFPGVHFIKITKRQTREQVESACNPKIGGKNSGVKAKYKYSTAGTKTSSILGYYHISRALGIKMVPPAVLRTLEKAAHESIVDKAVNFADGNTEGISDSWRGLRLKLQKRDPALVTPDGGYTYGALSVNPTNEQKTYNGVWLGGKSKKQRLVNFMTDASSTYHRLKERRPIGEFIGPAFNGDNYSALQRMKDVSDMIILDTLFGQRDRFGNTHSVYHWLIVDGASKVRKVSIDEVEAMMESDVEQGLPGTSSILANFQKTEKEPKNWRKEIRPRRQKLRKIVAGYLDQKGYRHAFSENLVLKDNDAGLTSYNPFAANRIIEWVYHVSPETFEQLMKLHQKVILEASMDHYLSKNLMMDSDDLRRFKAALIYVAEELKQKDEAGKLFKDLKIKSYFNL